MKKVIISGSTGFIGGALTRKLLSMGVTVYGIDINPEKLESYKKYGDFHPVVADFTKYHILPELIKDKGFDCFFHFAWKGGFSSSALKDYSLQLENANYACVALDCAKALLCEKFIFAGTCNEGEIKTLLKSDDNNISYRYTLVYSTAKLAAELIGKTIAYNAGIDFVSALIAMPFGEFNTARNLPNIIINQLNSNITPNLIEGNNMYDLVYIDDVVNAFIAIGEKGKNLNSYYIGHRNLKTFKQIITEIRDILNPNSELNFGVYKDSSILDYHDIDLNALYNDTGFECKADFRESILKTAEWVKTLNWN